MRNAAFWLTFILVSLLMIGGVTSAVFAVGAPSENFTTPDPPLIDDTTPEVKPPHEWQGASAQSQAVNPSFNCIFISQSAADQYTVTDNETWELLVDINMPGWLYIYEYFPPSSEALGRWIAYKWQPGQSGIWKLGPFSPAENEPEGLHLCHIWYYADGRWAASDIPGASYKELSWTYVKATLPPITPVTPVPSTASTSLPDGNGNIGDTLLKFLTNPIVLLVGPSVLVVIFIFIRYFISRGRDKKPVTKMIATPAITIPLENQAAVSEERPAVTMAEGTARFKGRLLLPGHLEIKLTEKGLAVGRADLARVLGLDELGQVSRQHFKISFEGKEFLIEDCSTNGTSLNGMSIAGQGPVKLNDGDLIEPASLIKLKFQRF